MRDFLFNCIMWVFFGIVEIGKRLVFGVLKVLEAIGLAIFKIIEKSFCIASAVCILAAVYFWYFGGLNIQTLVTVFEVIFGICVLAGLSNYADY